jgi:hypothetical protein
LGWSEVSRLLGSGPATSVRAIDLDFLGPEPFRCENTR